MNFRTIPAMLGLCLCTSVMPMATAASDKVEADGRHDFDFAHGSWSVHNRRMLKALSGSPAWEEFEAGVRCWPVLAGVANQDEYITPHRPGVVAMTLRLFNPKTRLWTIHWIDSRTPVMDATPVVGRFEGDTGVFESADTYDGKPIIVRYIWSRTKSEHPRWEQAFSADNGKTWEVNWVMDFTRVAAK